MQYAGFYYLLISRKNDDLKHLECEQTGALFISITLPSPSSRRWSEGVFVFCSGEFPQLLQLWLGDVRWISSWVILLRKLSSVTSDKHPSAAFNGVLIISSVTWLCQIISDVSALSSNMNLFVSSPHITHNSNCCPTAALRGHTAWLCSLVGRLLLWRSGISSRRWTMASFPTQFQFFQHYAGTVTWDNMQHPLCCNMTLIFVDDSEAADPLWHQ